MNALHMGNASTASTPFAQWLKIELDQRGWGIRTLARKMDPDQFETVRRKLNMYVHEGVNPGAASREEIEQALGVSKGSAPNGDAGGEEGD